MKNKTEKIEYYDLKNEALAGRLPEMIGRSEEIERLNRIFGRRLNNNILLIGPNGIGKTTLMYGWIQEACRMPEYDDCALIELSTEHMRVLDEKEGFEEHYAEALRSLPSCVALVEDFGREVFKNPILTQRIHHLYKQVLKRPSTRVVLTLEPHEHMWLEREYPAFVHEFETIHLKQQASFEYMRVLGKKLPRLNAKHRVIVSDTSLREVVSYAERFPALGQLPRSAIHLLDEALSLSTLARNRILTLDTIARVVEAKTGVPKTQLTSDELSKVRKLEKRLNERIIGQKGAIARIAATLQRAKLGLRNTDRPLGSFLLLGPSGVGKTETAKNIADIMFGRRESFIRFDMSEFQQDHTVQRLIGAPAGYVGYEEGGALPNRLKKEPYSLILLDEIEKAHPKVFDVFLQVLDDGRLTSGQNETVDARNAIVMATSNVGVAEILDTFKTNPDIDEENFVKEKIVPVLTKTFRLEFINRFDSILIFRPLNVPGLLQIAELEIKKIETRLKKHRVRFEVDPTVIENRVRHMMDPRFGARPVKRFIEETCETLLMRALLNART